MKSYGSEEEQPLHESGRVRGISANQPEVGGVQSERREDTELQTLWEGARPSVGDRSDDPSGASGNHVRAEQAVKIGNTSVKRIEAGIWKELNGSKYLVRVSNRCGKGGRRVWRQRWTPNLLQARKIRKEFEIGLGEIQKNGPEVTLKEIESDFMVFLAKDVSEETFYRQKGIYRSVFESLADRKMRDLTVDELEKFIDTATAGKAAQTRKHFICHLKKIFRWARKKAFILVDRMEEISVPKKLKRKDPLVLNDEQASLLIHYLKEHDPRVYAHVAVALYSAMRIGEIKALFWRDVDFERKTIAVSKTIGQGRKVKGYTKSGADRTIPINQEFLELLNLLKTETFSDVDSPVLPYWRECWSGEQAKVLKLVCVALNLPPIRFHDLRATSITCMFCHGVPLHVVKLISGHKRTETLEIYIRLAGRSVAGGTDCVQFFRNTPTSSPTVQRTEKSPEREREERVVVIPLRPKKIATG